ncbi:hypothetical protein FGADI_3242 [Fusarium gaditjirri]|uniref:Uncharacterized protein n=1 Tax=Fusarium gaditjirri TaxID=282569 RepID=A0A8H4TGE4_9HYPO|nr:hypothetical protein FGADI_3242 [Fusarium gaditjirri]
MLLKILVSITAAVAVTATAIGECDSGYEERGRSQCGDGSCCWTGSKALCCEVSDDYAVKDQVKKQDKIGVASCRWEGTAPYCEGECKPGWSERERSLCGDGRCCWTGLKALCCEDEDANQDL